MGFRTHEEEGALNTMSFDEYLLENREATFLLRMKGNSMKDSGILDGDLILMDRSKSAQVGDLVVVVIDGNFSIKYLAKNNGRFCLESSNESVLSTIPTEDLKVEAVVIAVVRKY
jgi:SOS-response transcriptional repressor LexA